MDNRGIEATLNAYRLIPKRCLLSFINAGIECFCQLIRFGHVERNYLMFFFSAGIWIWELIVFNLFYWPLDHTLRCEEVRYQGTFLASSYHRVCRGQTCVIFKIFLWNWSVVWKYGCKPIYIWNAKTQIMLLYSALLYCPWALEMRDTYVYVTSSVRIYVSDFENQTVLSQFSPMPFKYFELRIIVDYYRIFYVVSKYANFILKNLKICKFNFEKLKDFIFNCTIKINKFKFRQPKSIT